MISDAIEELKQELEKADGGGRLLPATEQDLEQAKQFGIPNVPLDFYRENAPDVADGWGFSRKRSPFSAETDHHSPVVDQRDRSEATLAF